jgi:hypothetical protein
MERRCRRRESPLLCIRLRERTNVRTPRMQKNVSTKPLSTQLDPLHSELIHMHTRNAREMLLDHCWTTAGAKDHPHVVYAFPRNHY